MTGENQIIVYDVFMCLHDLETHFNDFLINWNINLRIANILKI